MEKRLCPICDSKLVLGGFCPECKKIVANPVVIDSEMYLNERHSYQEHGCEYHSGPAEASWQNTGEVLKQPKKDEDYTVSMPRAEEDLEDAGTILNKKRRGFILSAAFFLCVLVPGVLIVGGNWIRQFVSENAISSENIFHIFDSSDDEEVTVTEDLTEVFLTEEEAVQIGVRCDALGHLPMDQQKVAGVAEEWYSANGYSLISDGTDSYNTFQRIDGIDYYIFMDETYSRWGKGEGDSYYLALSFDTATGEFHCMNACLETQEEVVSLALTVARMIEQELSLPAEEEQFLEFENIDLDTDSFYLTLEYGYFYAFKGEDGYVISFDAEDWE